LKADRDKLIKGLKEAYQAEAKAWACGAWACTFGGGGGP
jgi:hypothetical protein